MKKIKIYLPILVMVTIIGLSYNVIIPKVYSVDYDEQISAVYKDNMWNLGKNLSVGDSYTYKICDPQSIINYSVESYHYFTSNLDHNSSLCYVVKLDFVNLLSSDQNDINRDVWVVQTSISNISDQSIRRSVFHIDSESFEVKSVDTIHPDTIRYTQSVQNTLFSIFKYSDEPKLLNLGSDWGQVTESLQFGSYPLMKVLENNLEYSTIQNTIDYESNTNSSIKQTFSNVSKVGYDVDIVNNENDVITYYLISPEIPFPLSGVKYSPVHVVQPFKVFEFELLSYNIQNSESIVDEIIDQEIGNDVDNINEDLIVKDLIEDTKENEIIVDISADDIIDDSNNEEIINEDPIEETDQIDNVENMIPNEINSDTVELYKDSQRDNNFLNLVLIGFVIISIVLGILLAYLKIKKFPLKHVSKNISKKKLKPFSKIVHFKDNLTIKINKKDTDNDYSFKDDGESQF